MQSHRMYSISSRQAQHTAYCVAVVFASKRQSKQGCCHTYWQGTAQDVVGANWGDGFCCNIDLIKQLGLSDPTSFFRTLMCRPYRDQARSGICRCVGLPMLPTAARIC